jgi:beta-glucosidase
MLSMTSEKSSLGAAAGDEVVQPYIREEVCSVARPLLQLKGFRRVRLEPGETRTVTFAAGTAELCFYGLENRWIVEPGEFTIMVGGSSKDLPVSDLLIVKDRPP